MEKVKFDKGDTVTKKRHYKNNKFFVKTIRRAYNGGEIYNDIYFYDIKNCCWGNLSEKNDEDRLIQFKSSRMLLVERSLDKIF